jgi:hypothetical protein
MRKFTVTSASRSWCGEAGEGYRISVCCNLESITKRFINNPVFLSSLGKPIQNIMENTSGAFPSPYFV